MDLDKRRIIGDLVRGVLEQGGYPHEMKDILVLVIKEKLVPGSRLGRGVEVRHSNGLVEASFTILEPGDSSLFFSISVRSKSAET